MSAKDEFRKRLREAMKAAGMKISGTELERAFNRRWDKQPISIQAVTDWINGKSMPRPDRLLVLAKVLRVDPQFLAYGSPEPMSAGELRREWEDQLTYAERESIDAFLRLPAKQRLIVRDVIATYAKVHGATEPDKE